MEKGYSLYGTDISETINPLEAGLAWICDFSKEDFVGRSKLLELKAKGLKRKFVSFICDSKPIARKGDLFLDASSQVIGFVTSACVSPSLETGIGMGLVDSSYQEKFLKVKTRRKEIELSYCKNRQFV